MDESIKLDRKSFEALAGQTRVKVLKSLLRRRKTLTELSEELKLSPSTMKEHLDVLVDSELITQVDEGRKWKYYELTHKGRQIAEPHELRVWIMLGLSVVATVAAIFNLISAFQASTCHIGISGETAPLEGSGLVPEAAACYDIKTVLESSSGEASTDGEMRTLATLETEERDSALCEASTEAHLPFIQLGVATAAVLILIWALFYARGEGVL